MLKYLLSQTIVCIIYVKSLYIEDTTLLDIIHNDIIYYPLFIDHNMYYLPIQMNESLNKISFETIQFCSLKNIQIIDCYYLLKKVNHFYNKNIDSSTINKYFFLISPIENYYYPKSQRIYFEWTFKKYIYKYICLFYDYYYEKPLQCILFNSTLPLYIKSNDATVGSHIISIAGTNNNNSTEINHLHFIQSIFYHVTDPMIKILNIKPFRMDLNGFNITIEIKGIHFNYELQTDKNHEICFILDNEIFCILKSYLSSFKIKNSIFITKNNNSIQMEQDYSVFIIPFYNITLGFHSIYAMIRNKYKKSVFNTKIQYFHILQQNQINNPKEFYVYHVTNNIKNYKVKKVSKLSKDLIWKKTNKYLNHMINNKYKFCSFLSNESLDWICRLTFHEWGLYSQNGEDGIIQYILANISPSIYKYYVEFGVEDGQECNTRFLREFKGWNGLLMDGGYENHQINLHKHWIQAENINELLIQYNVPFDFDILSIDIDYNDFWILQSIFKKNIYKPRIIIIEYNSHIHPSEARTVPYKKDSGWDGYSDFFGASMKAFANLGIKSNYSLIYCESHGVNCFMVRNDLLNIKEIKSINENNPFIPCDEVYQPPNYFGKGWKYPNKSLQLSNSNKDFEKWLWI